GKGLKIDTGDANKIAANVGDGLKIDAGAGNKIAADFSTPGLAEAKKVCQANDPRLSDARTPLPHHATHENNGSDEINVNGLQGVLEAPQKIKILKTDASIGTPTTLSFSPTFTVDKASEERVNIDVKFPDLTAPVSTGTVLFKQVKVREERTTKPIDHKLTTN